MSEVEKNDVEPTTAPEATTRADKAESKVSKKSAKTDYAAKPTAA